MGRNPLDGWRSTDEKSANQQKKGNQTHTPNMYFFFSLSLFLFCFSHSLSHIFRRFASRAPSPSYVRHGALACARVCLCGDSTKKKKKEERVEREFTATRS